MRHECNIAPRKTRRFFEVLQAEIPRRAGTAGSEPHSLSTGLPPSTQAVVPPLRLRTLL